MRPEKTPTAQRRERRTLVVAVLASLLVHLCLLVLGWTLPSPPPRPLHQPLSVTIVDVPVPRLHPARPISPPPGPGGQTSRGAGAAAGPARPGGAPGFTLQPDIPFAVPGAPPSVPSLEAVSDAVAQAMVIHRGPQHPPGTSAAERLAESLHRGAGAMTVLRSGFWDAYFTELRRLLLGMFSVEHVRAHASKATLRIRLVLDVEGLLRDFDIVIPSGDGVMDADVERALNLGVQFPPPPLHVMQGKVELVTEWEFTVHPGLAPAQGELTWGGLGGGMTFDMLTLANPGVNLKPLERNVVLASFWTR